MNTPLQVLVVDDSALMRNLIGRIIEQAGHVVAARAMNGVFALTKLETLEPDVIVLDLEMPQMNGLEFLKAKAERGLRMPVIILSSIAKRGAAVTMEALELGAVDFITKPSGSVSEDIASVGAQLIQMIEGYGYGYRRLKAEGAPGWGGPAKTAPLRRAESPPESGTGHPSGSAPPAQPAQPDRAHPAETRWRLEPSRPHSDLHLAVLGISTGGPNALRQMLSELSADFPLPLLIVQHMPPGFTEEFARSLDRVCALEVKEAADGDLIKPGRVLIAPGDLHMTIERKALAAVVRVQRGDARNGHRPSVGTLFLSAAEQYGSQTLAVIMTGMGRDGAAEIGELYRKGALTVGQDEGSSVVYGMPKVAEELGHLECVVPLGQMAAKLSAWARRFQA